MDFLFLQEIGIATDTVGGFIDVRMGTKARIEPFLSHHFPSREVMAM